MPFSKWRAAAAEEVVTGRRPAGMFGFFSSATIAVAKPTESIRSRNEKRTVFIFLIAMEQITLFEGKFAIHLQHLDRTVEGVDVYHSQSARLLSDCLQYHVVRTHHHYASFMGIGKFASLFLAHVVDFLEEQPGIRRTWITQKNCHFPAVRPSLRIVLEEFQQFRGADSWR